MTSADSSDPSYRTRLLLHHRSDSIGVSGLLVLSQSFGAIYLGETFCSYICINNSSNFEVRDIIIKAEMQIERQRLVLLETSKSPVESIRAGGRYDFIVEQAETSSRSALRRRTRHRWSVVIWSPETEISVGSSSGSLGRSVLMLLCFGVFVLGC